MLEPNLGERLMTRKMLRPVALIGTVAAMLTVTIVLTLSHSTVSMSGVGSLKCVLNVAVRRLDELFSVRTDFSE